MGVTGDLKALKEIHRFQQSYDRVALLGSQISEQRSGNSSVCAGSLNFIRCWQCPCTRYAFTGSAEPWRAQEWSLALSLSVARLQLASGV